MDKKRESDRPPSTSAIYESPFGSLSLVSLVGEEENKNPASQPHSSWKETGSSLALSPGQGQQTLENYSPVIRGLFMVAASPLLLPPIPKYKSKGAPCISLRSHSFQFIQGEPTHGLAGIYFIDTSVVDLLSLDYVLSISQGYGYVKHKMAKSYYYFVCTGAA